MSSCRTITLSEKTPLSYNHIDQLYYFGTSETTKQEDVGTREDVRVLVTGNYPKLILTLDEIGILETSYDVYRKIERNLNIFQVNEEVYVWFCEVDETYRVTYNKTSNEYTSVSDVLTYLNTICPTEYIAEEQITSLTESKISDVNDNCTNIKFYANSKNYDVTIKSTTIVTKSTSAEIKEVIDESSFEHLTLEEIEELKDIDNSTSISYDYLNKIYTITNLGTNTTRTTNYYAKKVLNVISSINNITLKQLSVLANTYETLYSLSYTLDDKGSSIMTVQINSFSDYPIVMNGEKDKLYVMNSNVIFSIDKNERADYRVKYLCNHYKTTLGVDITQAEMTKIYNLLIGYYKPSVYNQIDSETMKYTSNFSLTNYEGNSNATYTMTCNPNEEYTSTENANKVLSIEDTVIYTLYNIYNTLSIGDRVAIEVNGVEQKGIITDLNLTDNYSRAITVDTSLADYTYTLPKVYTTSATYNINTITSEGGLITLTTTPSGISSNDKIVVRGIGNTCDKEYTVYAVNGNTISVAEGIDNSYTYSTGSYPILYKRNEVCTIDSISGTTLHVYINENSTILSANTLITVEGDGFSGAVTGTVSSMTSETITLSSATFSNYTPNPISLDRLIPSSKVQVKILTSNDTNLLPIGTFTLDNFTQAKNYVGMYEGVVTPTQEQYENSLFNKAVIDEIEVTGLPTLKLLGLYSTVYGTSTES